MGQGCPADVTAGIRSRGCVFWAGNGRGIYRGKDPEGGVACLNSGS